MSDLCPLCKTSHITAYHQDQTRDYWQCLSCDLIFVPPSFHLNRAQEKAEYDKHQNNPQDSGYRKFLSRLFGPLSKKLSSGDYGLDFGCGPGPTLSLMFSEQGWTMALFDIHYYPDKKVLTKSYQFICLSEVIEHLANPAQVIPQLLGMLDRNGWLGIMTKRAKGIHSFKHWHYKNDPTHIGFYSEETFQWIAEEWNLQLEVAGDDVILLKKN